MLSLTIRRIINLVFRIRPLQPQATAAKTKQASRSDQLGLSHQ